MRNSFYYFNVEYSKNIAGFDYENYLLFVLAIYKVDKDEIHYTVIRNEKVSNIAN
jgi:hypothetical protein